MSGKIDAQSPQIIHGLKGGGRLAAKNEARSYREIWSDRVRWFEGVWGEVSEIYRM